MWMERHPGYVFANDIRRGLDIFYVSSMGPGFLARGTIDAGHPATFEAGVGITRAEFEETCEYTPRTNGVDAWVAKVPADLADGRYTVTARGASASGEHDLDLFFYDEDCGLIGEHAEIDTDTSAPIPGGTAYILTANWLGDTAVLNLTTQKTSA